MPSAVVTMGLALLACAYVVRGQAAFLFPTGAREGDVIASYIDQEEVTIATPRRRKTTTPIPTTRRPKTTAAVLPPMKTAPATTLPRLNRDCEDPASTYPPKTSLADGSSISGSHRTIICNYGYKLQGTSTYAVCDKTGHWVYGAKCVPETFTELESAPKPKAQETTTQVGLLPGQEWIIILAVIMAAVIVAVIIVIFYYCSPVCGGLPW